MTDDINLFSTDDSFLTDELKKALKPDPEWGIVNRDKIVEFIKNPPMFNISHNHNIVTDRYEPLLRGGLPVKGIKLDFIKFKAWDIIKQSELMRSIRWSLPVLKSEEFDVMVSGFMINYPSHTFDKNDTSYFYNDLARQIEYNLMDKPEKSLFDEIEKQCIVPQTKIEHVRVMRPQDWFFVGSPKTVHCIMNKYNEDINYDYLHPENITLKRIRMFSSHMCPEKSLYLIHSHAFEFIPDEANIFMEDRKYGFSSKKSEKEQEQEQEQEDLGINTFTMLMNIWCKVRYQEHVVHELETKQGVTPVMKYIFEINDDNYDIRQVYFQS